MNRKTSAKLAHLAGLARQGIPSAIAACRRICQRAKRNPAYAKAARFLAACIRQGGGDRNAYLPADNVGAVPLKIKRIHFGAMTKKAVARHVMISKLIKKLQAIRKKFGIHIKRA